MNQLLKKHAHEIETILTKYPPDQKRASVMPLLHLAQQEYGYITQDAMREVAEIAEIDVTEVASIVGFYTLFHSTPGGKIRIQVCTDIACVLRDSRKYLQELCQQMGLNPGETSADGLVIIEEVKCLAACDRAPMFQSQIGSEISYHENQTVERTMDWLNSMMASLQTPVNDPPYAQRIKGGSDE